MTPKEAALAIEIRALQLCWQWGLPVDVLPRTHFVESIEKLKLFIQGELDPFGDAAAIESLLERVPEPKELVVIPGSDHFFAGRIEAVEAAVSNWAPRAIAS